MPTDYESIVQELQSHGALADIETPIADVGRNRVWRLGESRTAEGVSYVKLLEDGTWFERELLGLEIAAELADRNDWIMAPEVRYVDRDRYAHVTGSLPGETVSGLLRRAYRLDRNPLRRRQPREEFGRALDAVVRWMDAFHGHECPGVDALYDHTLEGVRDRAVAKLRRALEEDALSPDGDALSKLAALPLPDSDGSSRLICGDATLGNFLWDGRRIGRVDFEDLGCGAPGRDHFSLRQHLATVESLLWYWSVGAERSSLPDEAGDVEARLYRLEWLLDDHWRRHRAGFRWRAKRTASEIGEVLARMGVR